MAMTMMSPSALPVPRRQAGTDADAATDTDAGADTDVDTIPAEMETLPEELLSRVLAILVEQADWPSRAAAMCTCTRFLRLCRPRERLWIALTCNMWSTTHAGVGRPVLRQVEAALRVRVVSD
eukprot:1950351-Pleurochrysis_carterae.AAC.1